jgi:GxxExxY protein
MTKNENELSYMIRGAIFRTYNNLGPGLLESAYEAALVRELKIAGLKVRTQVPVPLMIDEYPLDLVYKMDILVEDKVLIEIKSVENLREVHHKQVITYLKIARIKLGLLVNFNCADIQHSIYRKVNGLDT